jgi:hypothetical protein
MIKTSWLMQNIIATLAVSTFVGTTRPRKSFHINGKVSASTGAATVTVLGSNDGGVTWVVVTTLSLTLGTTLTTAGYFTDAAYQYWAFGVTAISGTNATVNGYFGN